jgi:hypothetical protein
VRASAGQVFRPARGPVTALGHSDARAAERGRLRRLLPIVLGLTALAADYAIRVPATGGIPPARRA